MKRNAEYYIKQHAKTEWNRKNKGAKCLQSNDLTDLRKMLRLVKDN